MVAGIEEFLNASEEEKDAFFKSLPEKEQNLLLDEIAKLEETAPEEDPVAIPETMITDIIPGADRLGGEIVQGPTTLQDRTTRDLVRSGAAAAGAVPAGLAALGVLGTGPVGLTAAALAAAAGGAAAGGTAEAGMQGIDAAELKYRFDAEDPSRAFSGQKILDAGIQSGMEGPLALGGEVGFLALRKALGPATRSLGREAAQSAAEDELGQAILGTQKRFFTRLSGETVKERNASAAFKELVNERWEPLLRAEKADELFESTLNEVQFTSKLPRGPKGEVTDKALDDTIDETAEVLASWTSDMGAAEARTTLKPGAVTRIARTIDSADKHFKDLGLNYDLKKDILPKLGNIKLKDGKVNLKALSESGPDTLFGRKYKITDSDYKEKAGEFAERVQHLIEVSNSQKLGPRTIQDLKVDLDKKAHRAFLNKKVSSSTDVQKDLANYYRELLAESIADVDAGAGTQFTASLAKDRKRFQDAKDFLPVANELQILESTGKLTERQKALRNFPGGTLGGAAAGGYVMGEALESSGDRGTGITIGSIGGAALTSRLLPSRLARITGATKKLTTDQAPFLERQFEKAVTGAKFVLQGSISREAIDILKGGSEKLEDIKDALFVSVMKDMGMLSADGQLLQEIPPEIETQIEQQTNLAAQPISEAIRSGDELDVARSVALVAKEFPGAFPNAQIKGEVTINGKRKLPLQEDRMNYSMKLKDDSSLSKSQKARMRSAVHRDGSIITPPKNKTTAKIKD